MSIIAGNWSEEMGFCKVAIGTGLLLIVRVESRVEALSAILIMVSHTKEIKIEKMYVE